MRIKKTASPKARRAIRANEEIAEIEEPVVEVEPEATDLLFEVTDVADVLAEVTGEDVVVEADGDVAEFTIGDEVFTVEAEGDEEILEARKVRGRAVKASTKPARRSVRRARR